MILALEAADSMRLTCSECTPDLQKRRGCQKPGMSLPLGGPPFRFDSPSLQGPKGSTDKGLSILYECPTGYTLREAGWVSWEDGASATLHTDLRVVVINQGA